MQTVELRWTRFFYCTTMQSVTSESGFGWPHLTTTYEDHLDKGLTHKMNYNEEMGGKAFHIQQCPLPPDIRSRMISSVKDSKDDVKKAGTLSNQRAAAASAWLLGNLRTEFRSASMAWTGPLIAEIGLGAGIELLKPEI